MLEHFLILKETFPTLDVVTPAKAGVQYSATSMITKECCGVLDPRFRGDDGLRCHST